MPAFALIAVAASLFAAGPAPRPAAPAAPPVTKPAPPAFKPGMAVLDRTGAQVGLIETVAETSGGLNVVVKIDGKLVGLAPATLKLREGGGAVSSQTKQEMLAAAGAPR
jgi:hypothetical protein